MSRALTWRVSKASSHDGGGGGEEGVVFGFLDETMLLVADDPG